MDVGGQAASSVDEVRRLITAALADPSVGVPEQVLDVDHVYPTPGGDWGGGQGTREGETRLPHPRWGFSRGEERGEIDDDLFRILEACS